MVIILARCCRSWQPFGLPFEEQGRGQWLTDWASPVKEQSAKRKGLDRGEVAGALGFALLCGTEAGMGVEKGHCARRSLGKEDEM
ncbi:MAG: hypothetical protein K2R98_26755 [Gemmataceae bacterium]|nr:hypothetical protein [Gemmataceae bacterium]